MADTTVDFANGNVISSIEELEELVGKNNLGPEKKDGDEGNDDDDTGQDDEGKEPNKKKPTKQTQQQPKGQEKIKTDDPAATGGDEEEEEEEEEEDQYPSMIHYINDRFKLGLNVDALPEEFTAAEEAEAVAGIFEKLHQGAQAKIGEYQRIDEILKDREVAEFIKAKSEGKTLKDYVAQYSTSIQGLPADQVATKYLKTLNPSMADEDVKDLINNYRDKGKLDKLEADAKKYFQDTELREAKLKEQQEKEELERLKKEAEEDRINFRKYVNGIKNIADVAIDKTMADKVYAAATQVVDPKTGMTWLDRALLTDEGVFKAALGILYMEQLLKGKQSSQANRRKNQLLDTLFDTPDKLQSGSQTKADKDFDPTIANQF